MNIDRSINVTVIASVGELVQAIKLLRPDSVDIASLSSVGSGVTVTVNGRNVTITNVKTSTISQSPKTPTPNAG